ncbi:pkr1p [Moniliophthora roreri MCA 2997]|uniref:Pkr1p n=1 Tax=Moniliophthora roreri (strain MCA 2997) TaxID=1381753 RepID=V2XY14_MONRO|nr:pkr1p [Moniliophthora roreri MCA 2997]
MPEEYEGNPDSLDAATSFFSEILKPGSSLHPTFLLILDVAFAALLVILLGLLFATNGNVHIGGLIVIELCLWASVKWFVYELGKIPPKTDEDTSEKDSNTLHLDVKKTQ